MKTSNNIFKFVSCLSIALTLAISAANAQSSQARSEANAVNKIKLERPVADFGTQWLAQTEVAYSKVMLTWYVGADVNVANFEVECSFDLINYKAVGETSEEFGSNGKIRTFKFEDNSAPLPGQNIAQYRIKQTDMNGKVTYSEAKMIGLKS